jgi:transcriptional regulator
MNEIISFIGKNSFGQLISHLDGKLFSTHLPFFLSEDKTTLLGHLARSNPQHSQVQEQDVLVTFEGPHAYISPSWYLSPGVPTWNYQAVHIYGQCTLINDVELLKPIVEKLTTLYESKFENPWLPEYPTASLDAIVGIAVNIEEIQCKYKLSQVRSSEDRIRVVQKLKECGSNSLAEAMEKSQA